jgi:uncharacterized protein
LTLDWKDFCYVLYSNNLLTSAIKTPKLYFWDTGLFAYLCGWENPITLCNWASSGAFLENYVISELMKGSIYRGSSFCPSFNNLDTE